MTGLGGRVAGPARRVRAYALDAVGGPACGRAALTLAAVLGLSGADTGTISAVAGNLEHTFGIGNTQIGLLLSVVALAGATFTIPAGIATDRTRRTRLLGGSMVAWAVAMAVSGAAGSYLWLLLARLALGAVTATAGPAVASLTGDFAGLRSFAVIFATGHYGLSQPTATALVALIGVGALAGVYMGGRLADRMLRRGHPRARVLIPAVCLLALTPVLAPAVATTSVAVALPLLMVGAFLLGAPNPPLDAARLDIMHPRLWGRAEAVRTVVRSLGEAAAPAVFGFVSQYVFGSAVAAGGAGQAGPAQPGGNSTGLEFTFLIFLVPLLIAGLLALGALRTYPRDVATATASIRATGGQPTAPHV